MTPASRAMTPATRAERLRERLNTAFSPVFLDIQDESHLHVGHAGAAGGHGHFRVHIVAEGFRGISTLSAHRMIYAAVGDLLQTDIHALRLDVGVPHP